MSHLGDFEHHFQVSVGDYIPNIWVMFDEDIYQPLHDFAGFLAPNGGLTLYLFGEPTKPHFIVTFSRPQATGHQHWHLSVPREYTRATGMNGNSVHQDLRRMGIICIHSIYIYVYIHEIIYIYIYT